MGCVLSNDQPNKPSQTPKNTLNILCLGLGGCGKTTFIKQMRIIHHEPWQEVELKNFTNIIRGNFISGVQEAIDVAKNLGIALKVDNEEKIKEIFSLRGKISDLSKEQLELLKVVWMDPGVQEVIKNYNERMTITHLTYFWEHMDRIILPDYTPTDEDIVRARVRTAGSNSYSIYTENTFFEFFDVGGQKPERNKWEQVLSENRFSAVIFFVATDEYDVDSEETEKRNRQTKISISRTIFSELVNSTLMIHESIPIMLFLNRVDLFSQRMGDTLGLKAFKEAFPKYNGGKTPQEGLDYVKSFFLSVVMKDQTRHITSYNTCALDRDSLLVVWRTTREYILRRALQFTGFI